jgi:hypothetical protein
MLMDANVSYRVVRNTRLPWWFGYRSFNHGELAEIANGNLKSDENGKIPGNI